MKVRNGFVSNSSSSSFIINGVKISNEEGDKIEEKYGWNELHDMKLSLEQNRYFFSDDEPDGYIIGSCDQDMEDGDIVELTPLTEEKKQEIIEKLSKLGIDANIEEIRTYLQYISNDNY